MNRSLTLALFVCVLAANAKAGANTASRTCKLIDVDSTDGVIVAPDSHKVLYENPDVRVMDVSVAPHSREPMHTHARPAVMYITAVSTAKYITPEDPNPVPDVASRNFKPLLAHLDHAEGPHAVENVGDETFRAIRMEFKHPGCSLSGEHSARLGLTDALKVAPNNYKLLFENSDVRVLDVHIPAHSREPTHSHPWPAVLYLMQRTPTRQITPQGATSAREVFPDGVRLIAVPPQGPHSLENMGDVAMHFVRFEIKHGTPASPGLFHPESDNSQ